MSTHPPMIGDWYYQRPGGLFEVVAVDQAAGTIEVQYFDGTVEELELADWHAQCATGEIQDAEPPEDWSGSVDMDTEPDAGSRPPSLGGLDEDQRLTALGADDLDMAD